MNNIYLLLLLTLKGLHECSKVWTCPLYGTTFVKCRLYTGCAGVKNYTPKIIVFQMLTQCHILFVTDMIGNRSSEVYYRFFKCVTPESNVKRKNIVLLCTKENPSVVGRQALNT